MQRTEIINRNQLIDLIDFILTDSEVQIYESYSEPEIELVRINNRTEFDSYLLDKTTRRIQHIGLAIYYPENKGSFSLTKIKLNPKYCEGKTYRYRIDGWALIFLDLNSTDYESKIECRISVNTKTRAKNWTDLSPEYDSPDLWDWKSVEGKTRKLIRRLRKTTDNNG